MSFAWMAFCLLWVCLANLAHAWVGLSLADLDLLSACVDAFHGSLSGRIRMLHYCYSSAYDQTLLNLYAAHATAQNGAPLTPFSGNTRLHHSPMKAHILSVCCTAVKPCKAGKHSNGPQP
jgi:hypothetical protein